MSPDKKSMNACELEFTPIHTLSKMPPDTPILLALSGGADSRVLLHLLHEYSKKHGAPLFAIHVNHMIRGDEAKRDSDFCRDLCNDYKVPLFVYEVDVPRLAKENKLGLEDQARKVRYSLFERVMQENNIPILATAHNATDNAETVLFNMSRGSGLAGICGIPHCRMLGNGVLVRPIIKIPKSEIVEFCRANSLEFVTDSTNTDTLYSRNRIRQNVIPELEKVNSSVLENISGLCERASKDNEFLTELAEKFLREHVISDNDGSGSAKIPLVEFSKLKEPVATRVLMILGEQYTLSATNISDIMALAKKAVPHSEIHLPENRCVSVESSLLVFSDRTTIEKSPDYRIELTRGTSQAPDRRFCVILEDEENIFDSEKLNMFKNIYKKSTTITLDFDTIIGSVYCRPKQNGDTILCNGMHKKVKKLMCENKIPLAMREYLPIICDDNGILAIPLVAIRDGVRSKQKNNGLTITVLYN